MKAMRQGEAVLVTLPAMNRSERFALPLDWIGRRSFFRANYLVRNGNLVNQTP